MKTMNGEIIFWKILQKSIIVIIIIIFFFTFKKWKSKM